MSLSFDATFYQTQRPDVFDAFVATGGQTGLTWAQFAETHYDTFGRFEGSDPNASFDTSFYLSTYTDVAAAGVNPFTHFLNFGSLENRVPYDGFPNQGNGFDPAAYAAANADLAAAGITSDAALYQHFVTYGQFESRPGAPTVTPPGSGTTGETYVLTTAPDAFTGTPKDDTFVATQATLGSADTLDGAGGNDVLNYASSGGAAVNQAGFASKGIETINVTSDAGGALTSGTTFDVTGTTDVTTINNNNSSTDLTFVGGGAITTLGLISVGGVGAASTVDATPDTTVVYDAAVVAGASDAQTVNLNGNKNVDGTAVGDVTVNGIETINAATNGSASLINGFISGSLGSVVVTGDQNLTLGAQNFAANASTLDASAFTGNLNANLTNSAAVGVTATGGTGDDTVSFQTGGFTTGDSFDGGAGNDTIGLDAATASGATITGTVKNVENLNVTTITGGGTNLFDMDNFGGVTNVNFDAGLGAATTVDDAVTGLTVGVDVGAIAQNLTVDLKTDDSSDELTVAIDEVGTADALGTVNIDDAETATVSVDDDTAVNGTGTVTITNLSIVDAATLNLSGNANLTIGGFTGPATNALATVDASGMTGNLNVTGLGGILNGTASTVTLGSGNDTITGGMGLGSDKLTTGDGKDTITYTAFAQSAGTKVDTITDFAQGSDVLNLQGLVGNATGAPGGIAPATGILINNQFVGNFANFGSAQGAVTAASGTQQAVFQQDTNTLWVDSNDDGTLNANDLQIVLSGITDLTVADLGLTGGVTFTAKVNSFNTGLTTDSNEGLALTNANDVINATVAQIPGSAINGLLGTDTMNISGTAAAGEIANLTGAFTNVQTVNIDSSVEGVNVSSADVVAGQLTTIGGAAGTFQTLTTTGATLDVANIANIETLLFSGAGTNRIDEDNFASFSTFTGSAGADALSLLGNAATDDFDFSGKTVSLIETIDIQTADDVTFDAVDLANVTAITNVGGSTPNADLFFNNTTNIDGIAITDTAVDSASFGANTLTIDNDGVADDITAIETFIGTAGSTLVLADDANAAFGNSQISGVTNLNAAALVTSRSLTVGTGANGLNVTTGAIGAGNDINVSSGSNITLAMGAENAAASLDTTGTGNVTVTGFVGNDIDNAGSGALDVTIGALGGAVDIQAATTAASTTINAAAMADNEVLTVSDNGNATVNNVSDSDVTGTGSGNVTVNTTVTGVVTNAINLAGGNDQVNVTSVAAGATTAVDTGAGTDQITVTSTAGATVNLTGGAGADQINITNSAGNDTVDVTTNTDSLVTGFDVVTGFTTATDAIDSTTANAGNAFNNLNIASADTVNLAAAITTAIATDVAGTATNYDANGDAYLINIAAGTAAGVYVVVNEGATNSAFTAAEDVVVQLVNTVGVFTGADII
ncbi:calcium-binding protein [Labrenzia sp. R4_2]|uniref:beta strand repeat-containing protein n=1 Tax=Labrenzia sp. R4_2 TaxID=2821107 RepID=UPI001ADBF943|nr:calcium-binding protein [Labrenzia sp. R4_2]MBO9422746.1 calcium-binding protein [Labrenzia sp. R4_2]